MPRDAVRVVPDLVVADPPEEAFGLWAVVFLAEAFLAGGVAVGSCWRALAPGTQAHVKTKAQTVPHRALRIPAEARRANRTPKEGTDPKHSAKKKKPNWMLAL